MMHNPNEFWNVGGSRNNEFLYNIKRLNEKILQNKEKALSAGKNNEILITFLDDKKYSDDEMIDVRYNNKQLNIFNQERNFFLDIDDFSGYDYKNTITKKYHEIKNAIDNAYALIKKDIDEMLLNIKAIQTNKLSNPQRQQLSDFVKSYKVHKEYLSKLQIAMISTKEEIRNKCNDALKRAKKIIKPKVNCFLNTNNNFFYPYNNFKNNNYNNNYNRYYNYNANHNNNVFANNARNNIFNNYVSKRNNQATNTRLQQNLNNNIFNANANQNDRMYNNIKYHQNRNNINDTIKLLDVKLPVIKINNEKVFQPGLKTRYNQK